MSTAIKKTFAEMTAEVDAAKNNSDLANLAQSLQYVNAGRQELKKYIAKMEKEFSDLEEKIHQIALRVENGEYVDTGEVKDVYNRSRVVGPNL